MSATNAFESSLLSLIFENANAANVGDGTGLRGSSTAGVFWISLHTGAGPGETGNQETNEATYTDYARVDVARSTAGWTVSGNTVDNDAAIDFPEASAGSSTVTFAGLGSDETGTGNLFLYAATNSLAVSAGITPSFAAGALDFSLD